MDEHYCTRVTGRAFAEHYATLPKERQGPQREKPEVKGVPFRSGRYHDRELAPQPVFDVLCGSRATYWVRGFDSIEFARCCERCLSATVDRLSQTGALGLPLPVAVGRGTPNPLGPACPETDQFGGQCVYREGHAEQMNHRFAGGDEEARHQAALESYDQERAGKA